MTPRIPSPLETAVTQLTQIQSTLRTLERRLDQLRRDLEAQQPQPPSAFAHPENHPNYHDLVDYFTTITEEDLTLYNHDDAARYIASRAAYYALCTPERAVDIVTERLQDLENDQ